MTLLNERTRKSLATSVELADTRRARRRGLLGRDSISADEAMVITPCVAVHTAFMRFAIDVVFIDDEGRAVQLVHDMQPWRMAASLKGHAVIELAAGRLKACGIQVGDRLSLSPDDRGPAPFACRPGLSDRRPAPCGSGMPAS